MPSRSRWEDDDDDDRPRSRRRDDDDDDDDRPRRRRRDEDDEDDRPRRRTRRRSGGSGVGKVIAIVGGSLAAVGLVVLVIVLIVKGVGGRVDISYEKYAAIGPADTIEGLEKKIGRGTKYGPTEWASVRIGERGKVGMNVGGKTSSLADYSQFYGGGTIAAWYGWKQGDEEVYVAQGTDRTGKPALLLKLYCNPKVVEDAVRNPGGNANKGVPWFELADVHQGVLIRFGA